MRRRYAVSSMVVVAAAVAGGMWVVRGHDSTGAAQPPPSNPLPTATVTRGDLTQTTQAGGSLGYAGDYSLLGFRRGTITWLPDTGTVLHRGEAAYHADQHAVPLFYGNLPFYRTLRVGSTGSDVRELEQNLVALGLDDYLTVDDHYTSATAWAVQQWQASIGIEQTGVFPAGGAVVAPRSIRVTSAHGSVGLPAPQGRPVLQATSTVRNVHVDLSTDDQSYVHTGQHVTVELPSGAQRTGTVTSVGTVATATSGGDADQSTETIPVDIRLRGSTAALGGIDQAPVSVQIVSRQARGVLSVPVEALHAVSGGSYVVYVVHNGRVTRVPIATGLFSTDQVQISGPGIRPGVKVQVPRL